MQVSRVAKSRITTRKFCRNLTVGSMQGRRKTVKEANPVRASSDQANGVTGLLFYPLQHMPFPFALLGLPASNPADRLENDDTSSTQSEL